MDGEPPPAPVAATTSDLQKLRAQLKVYKRTFKEMHGRMPQKEDIQHRPKILHLYKQYSALQKSTATVTEGAPRVKEQENRSTFEANSSSSHPGKSTNSWLTRKDLPGDRGDSKNPRKKERTTKRILFDSAEETETAIRSQRETKNIRSEVFVKESRENFTETKML